MSASPLHSTAALQFTGVKVMVHGGPGVGKTRLAATAPAPVILSAEQGLLSLRKYNIPYLDIKSLADLRAAWTWVSKSTEAKQFKTVLLDSVTEIADVILREAKSKTKDARMAYGDVQDEIAILLWNFRQIAGLHVVFIFQSEPWKDEFNGTTMLVPTIPGQMLKPKLPYLTDEVFYMYRHTNPDGTDAPVIQTQPDFRTIAKDRSGALNKLEPPDLAYIFDKIAKG